jgi:predicted  nucleic acid-binding Zn-ribbon protein
MATEQVNRQINIFIQSGDAQKVYDKLIAKEKELNKQLKETSDPTRIKKLNDELDKLQEPISRASKKLRGELAPSLKEQEALVKKLGSALAHMSKQDANF